MADASSERADPLTDAARRGPAVVIDDSAPLREILRRALTQWGFQVVTQETGRDAGRTVRTHGASIVITDVFMPDTDGIEVVHTLRKECPGTPIIVISGDTPMGDSRGMLTVAQALGVAGVLRKPFSIDELRATLVDALSHGH